MNARSILLGLSKELILEDEKFIILFTNSLNQFFDKVKVNSNDEKLKENRKALVNYLFEK